MSMRSTGSSYNYLRSFERLDEILDATDAGYVESDGLPSRDTLTFSNGFYVKAAALFVDIRKSTELASRYSLPGLAKLYRAFISETVAVLDGNPHCDEVNIVGDGVWGIFEARWKTQVDSVVDAAAQVSSLLDVFNEKLTSRGYDRLYVGIGLQWGRALMLKSGFYGSSINDVVYMGNVVNSAAKLCSYGEADVGYGLRNPRVIAGSDFVANIESDLYRSFFSYNPSLGAYTASIHDKGMSS
jgi:class 3 adenylate cyclase